MDRIRNDDCTGRGGPDARSDPSPDIGALDSARGWSLRSSRNGHSADTADKARTARLQGGQRAGTRSLPPRVFCKSKVKCSFVCKSDLGECQLVLGGAPEADSALDQRDDGVLRIEVAAQRPLLVALDGESGAEAEETRLVREDADDPGAAAHGGMVELNRIRRVEPAAQAERQVIVRQRSRCRFLEPRRQRREG